MPPLTIRFALVSLVGTLLLAGGLFVYAPWERGESSSPQPAGISEDAPAPTDVCSQLTDPQEREECSRAAALATEDYPGAVRTAEQEDATFSQGENRQEPETVSGMFWVIGIALQEPLSTPKGEMNSARVLVNLEENETLLYGVSLNAL